MIYNMDIEFMCATMQKKKFVTLQNLKQAFDVFDVVSLKCETKCRTETGLYRQMN